LPGYSNVSQHGATAAKGFVFAFGVGADMEMKNHVFATLGAGYELGFQSITDTSGAKLDYRTRYVRVNLGGGVRFF
jgi:hypothetical protein